jgi:hypothetical protein
LNKVKYLMCQAGTGRPTVSKTQGQNSEPRWTGIRKSGSSWWLLIRKMCYFNSSKARELLYWIWGKNPLRHRAADLCWMHSSLLASVDIIEFQTADGFSLIDLTKAINNLCLHSRDEKVNVMLRSRRNSLITWEKMWLT